MSRIQVAFLLYIGLAGIAVSTLQGDFRLVVLALLAGLAIKTWIGEQKRRGTGIEGEGGTSPDFSQTFDPK
jgi:hypothetical protein